MHARCLMVSTDKADPSFFYFRISVITTLLFKLGKVKGLFLTIKLRVIIVVLNKILKIEIFGVFLVVKKFILLKY